MRFPAAMALTATLVFAVACQQPQPAPKADQAAIKSGAPTPAPSPVPTPNAEWAKSFPNCTWGEVKGGGASLWAFACPDDVVVFDPTVPGFVRAIGGANPSRATLVRLFPRAADAPLESILPALRAASPAPETCVLEPLKDGGPAGDFQLMPMGAAGKAESFETMPCGAFGPSEGGMRLIRLVPGAPTLAAVIFMPSDIATFDAQTLRGAP